MAAITRGYGDRVRQERKNSLTRGAGSRVRQERTVAVAGGGGSVVGIGLTESVLMQRRRIVS